MVYILFLFGFAFIPGKWQEIKLSQVRSWPDCERCYMLAVKEFGFCLYTMGSIFLLQNGKYVGLSQYIPVLITF